MWPAMACYDVLKKASPGPTCTAVQYNEIACIRMTDSLIKRLCRLCGLLKQQIVLQLQLQDAKYISSVNDTPKQET